MGNCFARRLDVVVGRLQELIQILTERIRMYDLE